MAEDWRGRREGSSSPYMPSSPSAEVTSLPTCARDRGRCHPAKVRVFSSMSNTRRDSFPFGSGAMFSKYVDWKSLMVSTVSHSGVGPVTLGFPVVFDLCGTHACTVVFDLRWVLPQCLIAPRGA